MPAKHRCQAAWTSCRLRCYIWMHAHMACNSPSARQHPAIHAAQTLVSGLFEQHKPPRQVVAIHTASHSIAAGVAMMQCQPESTGRFSCDAIARHRQNRQRARLTLGFSRMICQTAACHCGVQCSRQQWQSQQPRAHIRYGQRQQSPAAATGHRQAWRRLRTTQHQSELRPCNVSDWAGAQQHDRARLRQTGLVNADSSRRPAA